MNRALTHSQHRAAKVTERPFAQSDLLAALLRSRLLRKCRNGAATVRERLYLARCRSLTFAAQCRERASTRFSSLGVNALPVMERSVLVLVLRPQDQQSTEDVKPV
jgi:hypothetical protein